MSQPLTNQEMQRANELRARSELTSPQTAELDELLARADAYEAEQLAPHTQSLVEENEARATENRQLAALVERRQKLVDQLAAALQNARDEQSAIEWELQRILQAPDVSRDSMAGAKRP